MNTGTPPRNPDDQYRRPRMGLIAISGLLGAVALVSLSGARLRSPLWDLDARTTMVFALIAGMHLVAVMGLALRERAHLDT